MAQAKVIELALVKDPVAEINELHQKICLAAKTTVEDAIRIGELLIEQRKQCGHGNWLPWLKDNVTFAQRTAHRYMRIFKKRAELKFANVANLEDAYRIIFPKKDKPHKKEAKELSSEEADGKWLKIIKRIPERQWPQIAGAANYWIRQNGDLLKEINTKYNQPRSLPFKR